MTTNPLERMTMTEVEPEISNLDFEPYCAWYRDEDSDTLAVHLHGFRKDQMKVQVNNRRILTIYGQRPLVDDDMWTRFRKQIKLSDNCDENKIRAMLSAGVLTITMPKKSNKLAGTKVLQQDQLPHGHEMTNEPIDEGQKLNDHMVEQKGKGVLEVKESDSVYGLWTRAGKVAAVVLVLAFSGAMARTIYKRRSH